MPTYDHFYDLPVYQTCRLFKKNVSKIVKAHFPKPEEYHLKSQVLDQADQLLRILLKDLGGFITRRIFNFADSQEAL
jgi:hypothetical protein